MRAAATTYPLVGKLVMGTSRLLNCSVLAKADLVTFDDQRKKCGSQQVVPTDERFCFREEFIDLTL